jgi:hypothetical protein
VEELLTDGDPRGVCPQKAKDELGCPIWSGHTSGRARQSLPPLQDQG